MFILKKLLRRSECHPCLNARLEQNRGININVMLSGSYPSAWGKQSGLSGVGVSGRQGNGP